MRSLLAVLIILAACLTASADSAAQAPENLGLRAYAGVTENEAGNDAIMIMGQLHYLFSVSGFQIGPFAAVGAWGDQTEGLFGAYCYRPVVKSLAVYGGFGLKFIEESSNGFDFGFQYSLFRSINDLLPDFMPRIPLPAADLQLGLNNETFYIGLAGGSGSQSWADE